MLFKFQSKSTTARASYFNVLKWCKKKKRRRKFMMARQIQLKFGMVGAPPCPSFHSKNG